MKEEAPSLLTEESLNNSLADVYEAMRLFTTSTSISETTSLQISLFKAVLNIANLTLHLSGLFPSSSESGSSSLTAIQEYTNYARQAARDLFAAPQWFCEGSDLIREAEQYKDAFRRLGDWASAAAVLFEPESLRGDSPPSRKARQRAAAVPARSTGGGGPGTDCDGGLIHCPPISPAIKARDHKGPSSDGDGDGAPILAFDTTQVTSKGNRSNPKPGDPCHPLAAGAHPPAVCVTGDVTHALNTANNGKGSSEDGTGRGVPTIAIQEAACRENPQSGPQGAGFRTDDTAFTLEARQRPQAVATRMQVRRLTPVECERLQGFPDGYTAIPWRNKPAEQCPDGPRYKALGNSMAVPVMRWVGERIEAMQKYDAQEAA